MGGKEYSFANLAALVLCVLSVAMAGIVGWRAIVGEANPESAAPLSTIANSKVESQTHSSVEQVASPAPAPEPPIDSKHSLEMLSAARSGNAERVRELLLLDRRLANVISEDQRYSPLNNAAYGGYPEIVQDLLDAGATVDRALHPGGCIPQKQTALYCATTAGHAEIVELLLTHGANPDPKAKAEVYSPFVFVVSESQKTSSWDSGLPDETRLRMLRAMVKAGAKLNSSVGDYEQRTPLHVAVRNADLKLAKVLLELGADPNAKTVSGETPLDYARKANSDEMLNLFAKRK